MCVCACYDYLHLSNVIANSNNFLLPSIPISYLFEKFYRQHPVSPQSSENVSVLLLNNIRLFMFGDT